MNNKEMAIFISSPDSYSDVLQVFLECLNKYWRECPYEVIISTNTKKYKNATVYNNNQVKDSWMDRTIAVLKKIDYDYILLTCDDCFILNYVNTDDVQKLLKDITASGVKFCGLSNHIRGKRYSKNSNMVFVKNNKAYAKNLQTGIYEREYLLNILGDGDKTPWELESKWLKEAAQANGDFFTDITSSNKDILHCRNGVLKGKWYSSVIKNLHSSGIEIVSDREIIRPHEEYRLRLFSKIGKIVPCRLRMHIKKILKNCGFLFTSDN